MNAHYTYLAVDVACVSVPFLFSFHPRLQFYREWKYFILPCLLTALFFLLWDGVFTALGVWSFNPDYVIGVFLFGMPLEEFLFFICIPFAAVFSYHAFKLLLPLPPSKRVVPAVYLIVAVLLVAAGLFNFFRLYTVSTFLLLAGFLFFCLKQRISFLPRFTVCFLFILIPFFLSNGVLTGSFFGRVVVQYNDEENLGIRLGTIPVEDIFYGMLLLMMNIYGFEYLRKKSIDTIQKTNTLI